MDLRSPALRSVLVIAALAVTHGGRATAASATGAEDTPPAFELREHYTKYEYRIPMRDGARLFTSVFVPKDAGPAKTYPFLMVRTPYTVAPYGPDHYGNRVSPDPSFTKAGYIFVVQDVRGRSMSEGQWIEMTPHKPTKGPKDVDESTDCYDTVDWLVKNVPFNNGNAGLWGISYPGFYTAAGIIDTHPAIKAASPQAPVTDLYLDDDCYHGGAFMLAANFGFLTFYKPQERPGPPPKEEPEFDYGTTDAYDFFLKLGPIQNGGALLGASRTFWDPLVAHTSYDDFWQQRSIWKHYRNIRCAVLTVGGWFDAEDLAGPLRTYREIEANNPGIENALVMGPWVHGGWAGRPGRSLGHVDFASETATYYNEQILLPFFEKHLKGVGSGHPDEAVVFETGTNVWRRYPSWPAPGGTQRTLYLQAEGKLSFNPPTEEGSDRYVSDPAKPVPYLGYAALDVPQEYMVSDQRFAATRPDVLVYQSDPLEADVTLAGPLEPRLFAATTGTDADWVVKLIDVYPADFPANEKKDPPHGRRSDVAPPTTELGGYQQLVRGGPFRARYRNSLEHPTALTPNEVTEIHYTLPDVNHTFRRGHRIMIQVQSSWFPLVDRNPQTFVPIPSAKPEDFKAATQTIVHGPARPSGIAVRVLPNPGDR